MILAIGLDIIEVARLERAVSRHGSRFEQRVFTARELAACASRADRGQALAARFAAKEACMKALGTGWSAGVAFRQIELTGGRGRPPGLQLSGVAEQRASALGVRSIHVSLSHQPGMAAAVVVFEG